MGRLLMWTYSHFAVDFACFYILFAGLKTYIGGNLEILATGFLAYNVIAFGLQSVIGMICDERPAWRRMSGFAGCLMVLAALATVVFAAGPLIWAAMVTAALGNAFFHVGGGIDVLRRSSGRMADSGIFVSAGAMGVALGTLCSSAPAAFAVISSATVFTGITVTGKTSREEPEYVHFKIAKKGSLALTAGLLMTAVFIRSYAGLIMPMEWERAGWFVILPAAASCLGKALGGIAGDRFGAARTGAASLLACVPLICVEAENMVLSLSGILLFNMTMPVTLCAAAALMPRNTGFAFGLTTLALLLGTVITYFLEVPDNMEGILTAVLTILAAVCIWLSVNNEREDRR